MTNKEALEILEHNWTKFINPDCTGKEIWQALGLALKALKDVEGIKEENHKNFVNSQYIISLLIEENKKLRGEEE